MSQKRVARSYAEALFAIAQKWGQEDQVGARLNSLKTRLEEDAEWQRVLSHRLTTPEEKEKTLKALLPRLLERTDEETIITTVDEYQTLLDQSKNMELMEITAAAPLSAALITELENRLSNYVGKKIRLTIKVDPKILGGLVIHWGDQVLDASVKKKLEFIGTHLKTT